MFAEASEKISLEVMLTLTSGEQLHGELLLNRVQKLLEFLNKPEPFLDFLTRDGRNIALAKHSIASAVLLDPIRTDQLSRNSSVLEPHRELGIEPGASPAEVRAAYLAKVKLYHPDQFAGNSLPKEVADYMQAMFVRVQAAYKELTNKPVKAEPSRTAET